MKYHCKYVENLKHLAEERKFFNLRSIKQNYWFEASLQQKQSILLKVIEPLLRGASHCYLYWDGENSQYQGEINTVLKKKKGKYEIELCKDITSRFENFWFADGGLRGSIMWFNQLKNIQIESIFEETFDPFILDNLGTCFAKPAISFARKRTLENPNEIAIGLSRTNGLEWITIFAHHSIIANLVKLSLQHSIATERYMQAFGFEADIDKLST